MRITTSLLLAVLAAPLTLAQEGPFRGSITTGYRFTDVKGYEPKFQELFDLNSGLRLLDLNLFGQTTSRYIDHYSLSLSGIGGEPYSTAQLNIRKTRRYD